MPDPPSTPTVARQISLRAVPFPLPRSSIQSHPSHTSPGISAKPTSLLHQQLTSSQDGSPGPRCLQTATTSPTALPALLALGLLAPTHLLHPHSPLSVTICLTLRSAAANATALPVKVTASSLIVAAAAADMESRIPALAALTLTLMRNIAVLAAHCDAKVLL